MTWLKANDLSAAGAPSVYASKTPKLEWVTAYTNTAAANQLVSSSAAFSVAANHDSAYLSDLFVNDVGRTYKMKMVSYDTNSKSEKNRVVEEFTVAFSKSCNLDSLCITGDGTNCLAASSGSSQAD